PRAAHRYLHSFPTRRSSDLIIPFTLPIGKEKDFRGVVDVVHMKAYELGADGQAKEIEIPSEGREYVDKTRERLVELVAESDDAQDRKSTRLNSSHRTISYAV